MIVRNLITATLVATAPVNTTRTPVTIHTQVSEFSTIMTNQNVIKLEQWNTEGGEPTLENGQYYVIKELQTTPLELLNRTVLIKGYQYTYIDYTNQANGQYIDYYIRVKSTLNDQYSFEKLEFIFNGISGSQLYYEDYYFSYLTSTANTQIDDFLLSDNYNFLKLQQVRTVLGFQNYPNSQIDTVQANATLPTEDTYTYYRWRLVMRIDDENTTPQNAINDTAHYYDNVKVIYYYNTVTDANYEVVDIPGLMFEILGMPFAWISTAFNLTIFPGTPYAINISHLFMSIIGALILIIILKKILK